jgi:hypothetical protein
MVVLESSARVWHFLHLLAGVCCIAACTHLLVRLIQTLRRRRVLDRRLRTHASILALAYVATFTFGSLFYPSFRVRVRAEYLDPLFPWATGLFEIKEHAATLALLPVLGIFAITRVLGREPEAERPYLYLLSGLSGLVLCILLYNACVGWYLGTLRSV